MFAKCPERRRAEGRRLHGGGQGGVVVGTDVEARAGHEERLTRGVVVRCVDPARAPEADAPVGRVAHAVAHHLLKGSASGLGGDAQGLPLRRPRCSTWRLPATGCHCRTPGSRSDVSPLVMPAPHSIGGGTGLGAGRVTPDEVPTVALRAAPRPSSGCTGTGSSSRRRPRWTWRVTGGSGLICS